MPYQQVNDINLYYEIHGAGYPMIFIAGFGHHHSTWLPILKKYTALYQVILIDNRGTGKSDAPDYPYTIDMMANDIVQLCLALNIKKAGFVGHSMGGKILQTIAYQHPALVQCAVIVNSSMKMNKNALKKMQAQLLSLQGQGNQKELFRQMYADLFTPEFFAKYEKMFASTNIRVTHPISEQTFRNQLNAIIHFNSQPWISQIQSPCLFITSDQDRLSPPEEIELASELVKNSQYLCIKNAGHIPQIEQPEAFNQAILDFLAQNIAPTV